MNALAPMEELFAPTSQFVGHDATTGEPVYLGINEMLGASMEIIGRVGEGKTDTIVETQRLLAFTQSPYIVFDYADTGFDQALVFDAGIAHFLWSAMELPYRDVDPSVIGITEEWIGRHAYATVGVKNPPIRINPFRRVRFPDGTTESPEDCAGRNDRVWAAQFPDDIGKRVQFRLYLRAICGLLSAGDCYISDYTKLFEDPDFRDELVERQKERGTFDDPFIVRQWELIRAVDVTKREGRDEVHSLRNALEPLVAGVLAEFFSDENFALEDVVYGNKRLHISVSGLTSSESKKFVMRTLWAMVDTLVAKRRFMDNDPLGVEFIDEIPWLMPDFFEVIARRRNNRWASVVIRQTESAQFDMMGLRSARDILRQATGCGISYGAENEAAAREYALQLADVRDDTFIEAMVNAVNTSQSSGSSLTDAISKSLTESRGYSTGSAHSVSVDSDGKKTVTDTASSSTTNGIASTEGTTKSRGVSHNVSTGESVTYQKYRISREEQIGKVTMDVLRAPRHRAVIRSENGVRLVDMAQARQLSQTVHDDAVRDYIEANELFHMLHGCVLPPVSERRAIVAVPEESVQTGRGGPELMPAARNKEAETIIQPPAPTAVIGPRIEEAAKLTTDTLHTVATVRLCTVQQVMMMLDYSYDRASRELDRLVKDGLIERIKRFAPRGEGSLPVTYILNATGARYLGQRGQDLEELLRIAKNLSAHRRALEDNLPTQDRHRAFASMLATIIMCAARRIDPSAHVTDVLFDRELTLPVDLKPFLAVIPDRDRLLISPDPTKTEVTYIPDFSFVLHWTLEGRALTEPVFGEVETGYGERNPKDLAIGKAWKLRAVQRLFENGTTIGKQQFAAGTMPRVLVWSRTPALEQGFFEGARTVYKDAFSPLWLTNGDVLPLGIPKGTKKTEIATAVRKLVDNVQTKAWRWLRFPDPANRRRLVGVQERGGR